MSQTPAELAEKLAEVVYNDLNEMLSTRADWMLLSEEERLAQAILWKERFESIIKGEASSGKYKAFFDGGAKPNPGIMTIGGYYTDPSGTVVETYSLKLGHGTNNVAEYSSLIFLLKRLIDSKIRSVSISGDSLLVINQIHGVWKANDKMKPYKEEALQLLNKLDWCELKHVLREHNKEADALT